MTWSFIFILRTEGTDSFLIDKYLLSGLQDCSGHESEFYRLNPGKYLEAKWPWAGY